MPLPLLPALLPSVSSANTLLPTRPIGDSDTLIAPDGDDDDEEEEEENDKEADDEAERSGAGECAGLWAPLCGSDASAP